MTLEEIDFAIWHLEGAACHRCKRIVAALRKLRADVVSATAPDVG